MFWQGKGGEKVGGVPDEREHLADEGKGLLAQSMGVAHIRENHLGRQGTTRPQNQIDTSRRHRGVWRDVNGGQAVHVE